MNRPFRSCAVFLIMSLLLIRSWAGDAMAIDMVNAAHTPAAAMVMADEDHAATDVVMPCHEMADGAVAHAKTDGSSHTADSCGTCTVCQLCHSTAMTALASPLPAFDPPQTVPRAALLVFSSAEPQQGFKPPIS